MSNLKKIAVLGGGNGAHAMAADLAVKGFEINMCEAPEFKEGFSATLERQEIDLIDMWGKKKTARLRMATTDFKEAVKGVDYIMLITPAIAHERFFSYIMPYLEDGQTLIVWTGYSSTLLFAKMLRERAIKKDIILGETQTLGWGCRLEAPARVRIFIEAYNFLLGVYPAKKTDRVMEDLKNIYDVVPAENVLASALNNLNPIVHSIGCILNAGWIDTLGPDFYLYRDGTTVSILRGMKAVYNEMARIANAIGVTMTEYPEEAFWSKSTIMAAYNRAPFDKDEISAKVSGPSSMKHRYITEDVPYGLVPAEQLAHKFGVATPIITSIIELASMINETDYRKEGRSLEELGIADLSAAELNKALQEGF